MTAKHPNSVPPQIVYPPGPIERQANTVPRGMLFGGGVLPALVRCFAAAKSSCVLLGCSTICVHWYKCTKAGAQGVYTHVPSLTELADRDLNSTHL